MSTVGNTSTPSFGNQWLGTNQQNQVWSTFTMPSPGGTITALHAYFDLNSGTGTPYCCLWDGSGNLLASVSLGSMSGTGNHSIGGQTWHSGTLSSGVFVASGATISLGFYFPQANGGTWSFNNSGSSSYNTQASGPGSQSGSGSTGDGSIGAYADYTPGGAAYVNVGTQTSPNWTQGLVYINTGSSGSPVWTPAVVYANTGSSGSPVWTPGS